jgi:O-succinylbenzoic acid--CoA ligase
MTINWLSDEIEVLINPRMPLKSKNLLLGALKDQGRYPGHIWISTSGTTGNLKWVLLSKIAILISSQAVNSHLQSDKSDVWLQVLPKFHVGGLGIISRSFLSGASVVNCHFSKNKWNPVQFVEQLNASRATLTSLVPAQIFDLVMCGLKSTPNLRAVIVGGGVLSEKLHVDAMALGWKLLPSYGLTECASQVATAELDSSFFPVLKPLPHIDLDLEKDGRLKIRSHALLTAYVDCLEDEYRWHDPKVDGWFTTEDYAVLENGGIKAVKRGGDFVKIGGESVDFQRLEKIFEAESIFLRWKGDASLIVLPHERLGCAIHLAVSTASAGDIQILIDRFHQQVFPFEQIRFVHCIDRIPRSPLGKVLREELKLLLTQSSGLT